ncbi:hypothetical protein HYDPIDRAFT_184538 [Hydnomerulius pinastri MD-312]|nr:hypothetical protein HYDPIDRAFT_184538 [Hydnomerulius pinastri MD-312]
MPTTRQSTRRSASKRKRNDDSPSDDSSSPHVQDQPETLNGEEEFILGNLSSAKLGVEKLFARIRSLNEENDRLRAELRKQQQSADNGTRPKAGKRNEISLRRQIQQLESTVAGLKASRKKDKRTIQKLRAKEVEQDAKELADAEGDGAQGSERAQGAIQLLRRFNDLMDMNTLEEGEECAICMEKMEPKECYSLQCRHTTCSQCFEKLGNTQNENLDTGQVQCPHCREICHHDECEVITHTAVQQWDALLEISQEWATMDAGEIDVGEEEDDEHSFIDDGPSRASQSSELSEIEEPQDPKDEGQASPPAATSPKDTTQNSYQNLPSPSKRERLQMLAAERANKRKV